MIHSHYPYTFDAAKIVDYFGGWRATHRVLESAGSSVKPRSIQKWRERGYIPSDALATLIVAASGDDVEFSLEDFLKVNDDG
jgi:hypothetical protein